MKILKRIAIVTLVSGVVLSANTHIDKIKSLKMFNNKNIEVLAFQENTSTYQIKASVDNNGQKSVFEAFITKDFKEIVIGKGFDAETQKPLLVSMDMKKHLDKAAYSIGSGKEEYIVFTDPECPYCHKLEEVLPELAKHAKFHVFLFPLSFHKNAKQMSYYIISQKDTKSKQVAMLEIANGSTKYRDAKFSIDEIEKLDAELQEQISVASMLGVNGTPAMFDTKGDNVNWVQLLDKFGVKKPNFN